MIFFPHVSSSFIPGKGNITHPHPFAPRISVYQIFSCSVFFCPLLSFSVWQMKVRTDLRASWTPGRPTCPVDVCVGQALVLPVVSELWGSKKQPNLHRVDLFCDPPMERVSHSIPIWNTRSLLRRPKKCETVPFGSRRRTNTQIKPSMIKIMIIASFNCVNASYIF